MRVFQNKRQDERARGNYAADECAREFSILLDEIMEESKTISPALYKYLKRKNLLIQCEEDKC